MNVETTAIDGVLMLQPKVFGDARGFFLESFNQNAFDAAVGGTSISCRTTIRARRAACCAACISRRARRRRASSCASRPARCSTSRSTSAATARPSAAGSAPS
jgi:hypothetical protein